MNTLDFILDKYNIRAEKSPIVLYNSRFISLPKLFKQFGFTVGAEIGVARGYYSQVLCKAIPNLKLYSIDAWTPWSGATHGESQGKFDRLYEDAKRRLAPYNCEIIKDWSLNAVKNFKDESLDFVFIDAGHDYKSAQDDIKAWSKKVRKGGIVAGDDYSTPEEMLVKLPKFSSKDFNADNYGVKRAVDDWVKKKGINHLFVFTKDIASSWFYIKGDGKS